MDDTTHSNFLRLQGQISATQILLAHVMRATPEAADAAMEGMNAVLNLAEVMDGGDDESKALVAIGMREALEFLQDSIGT